MQRDAVSGVRARAAHLDVLSVLGRRYAPEKCAGPALRAGDPQIGARETATAPEARRVPTAAKPRREQCTLAEPAPDAYDLL